MRNFFTGTSTNMFSTIDTDWGSDLYNDKLEKSYQIDTACPMAQFYSETLLIINII